MKIKAPIAHCLDEQWEPFANRKLRRPQNAIQILPEQWPGANRVLSVEVTKVTCSP